MKRDELNEELPNTRKISRMIVNPENVFSNKVSSLMYSFGQFVDHDLTLSPGKRRSNPGLGCCIGFPDFKVLTVLPTLNYFDYWFWICVIKIGWSISQRHLCFHCNWRWWSNQRLQQKRCWMYVPLKDQDKSENWLSNRSSWTSKWCMLDFYYSLHLLTLNCILNSAKWCYTLARFKPSLWE